jgi:plasmid replication initiation protein
MPRTDLVVKDNALINSSCGFSLTEMRLTLLAIVRARENGMGVTAETFLNVSASDYAKNYDITPQAAYISLADAVLSLFHRQITLNTTYEGHPSRRLVRWVSGVEYVDNLAMVRVRFSPEIIPLITRLEENFTSYDLSQAAGLGSIYAVRLFEILMRWKTTGETPFIALKDFREQMGLGVNEYSAMCDFKKRVLDLAVKQINTTTTCDWMVEVVQHKAGRSVSGFTFRFSPRSKTDKFVREKLRLNHKPKFEITDDFVSKHALIGESWEQARNRLRQEAESGKFSMSPTD